MFTIAKIGNTAFYWMRCKCIDTFCYGSIFSDIVISDEKRGITKIHDEPALTVALYPVACLGITVDYSTTRFVQLHSGPQWLSGWTGSLVIGVR